MPEDDAGTGLSGSWGALTIAVPIISTNEGELLRHALPAVLAQEDVEIVIVDNASEDCTAEVAQEFGVRRLALTKRRPYSAAMNEALAHTGGEAVLMMQPDCFLTPGFLGVLRVHLEDPSVGSVAPKLIRAEGPAEHQRLHLLDTAGMVVDRRRKNGLVGHGRPSSEYGAPAEIFGADGAAALYRRQALEDAAVEGEVFDENMVATREGSFADWGSDADLAWRLRLLGWRCEYEPRAVAYHVRRYSPTTRSRVPEWQRMVQFRNRYLMIVKNDPARRLLLDLPIILAYELVALGFALLRERFLIRGYVEAAALLPAMLRRRRILQRQARLRRASACPYDLQAPSSSR